MLKKILGTIGTRYLIALLNLALIFVNARVLGIEGVGLVGLIVASMNLVVIFNGILSGNTLVYFMHRYSMRTVMRPAYLWVPLGSVVACGVMALIGFLPKGYEVAICLLAMLNSYVTANARFLLGKDDIKGFNLTFMLQGGLLFFVLMGCYYGLRLPTVGAYVAGLFVTNGIAFVVSALRLWPYVRQEQPLAQPVATPLLLREMFAYGLWAGADNLAENCTTRLNYFLVERFGGLGSVGLLDAGTKIAESVWHISRSVSFIEYGEVAKTTDPQAQRQITLRLLRLTALALVLVMAIIVCIPEWCYTEWLFNAEFAGIRQVIMGLSVGIVTLGCNSVLSHYFIGSGRIRWSAASSAVGLVTLLAAGSWLIPAYGVVGSAVTTSIAFTAMLLFSCLVFNRYKS
ncbi:MAG: lipopolysaccharide biosynthesis protein [Parabacteroides sp.]